MSANIVFVKVIRNIDESNTRIYLDKTCNRTTTEVLRLS